MKYIALIVIPLLIFAGCDSSPTGPEDATLNLTFTLPPLGDHDYNDALVESRMKGFMKIGYNDPSRDGSEPIRRILTDYELVREGGDTNDTIVFRTSVEPIEGRIQIVLYDGKTGEVFQYAETERIISVRRDVDVKYDEPFTLEPSVITANRSPEGVVTGLTYTDKAYDKSSPYIAKLIKGSEDIGDNKAEGDRLYYSYNNYGNEDDGNVSIPEESTLLADPGNGVGIAEFPMGRDGASDACCYRPSAFPDSLSGRFRFDIKDSWRTEEGEGPEYFYYPNLGADPVVVVEKEER